MKHGAKARPLKDLRTGKTRHMENEAGDGIWRATGVRTKLVIVAIRVALASLVIAFLALLTLVDR